MTFKRYRRKINDNIIYHLSSSQLVRTFIQRRRDPAAHIPHPRPDQNFQKTFQKNLPKKLTKTRKFFESFGLAATRLLTEWVRRIQLRKNSTTMQDSDNDDHTRILTPSFKPSNQTPSMNQTVGTCAEDLDSHTKETPPR